MRLRILGLALAVAASCGPAPAPDAGVEVDSGRPDSGAPDAGSPDGGSPDAGSPDAGPPDAGPPDAGPHDAGPPDAGPPDAGPPDAGPPDAGPLDAGRVVVVGNPPWPYTSDAGAPSLAPVCVDGWCWEQPLPMAGIQQLAQAQGDDVWVLAGSFAARDLQGSAQVLRASAPITLAGGSGDNVWFRSGSSLLRPDAGAISLVPSPPFAVTSLSTTGPNDAWATAGQSVYRWNGAQWTPQSVFAAPVFASAISAVSPTEVWAAADELDMVTFTTVIHLRRFDGAQWSSRPAPVISTFLQLTGLLAFAADDVWLSLSNGLHHWDGATWTRYADVYGSLSGSASNLWAVSGSQASHWDGAQWFRAPPAPAFLTSVAPGLARELYGLSSNGALYLLRGDRWLSLTRGELDLDIIAIALPDGGRPTVAANAADGGRVLMRTDAGLWVRPQFPSLGAGALLGVTARAQDDQWAFGRGAAHYDGQAWVNAPFVPPPNAPTGWYPYLNDVCSFSAAEAVGYSSVDGFMTWDGGSWSADPHNARVGNPYFRVRCLGPAPGEAWATGETAAHRVGGRWRVLTGPEAPASAVHQAFSAGRHHLISAAQRAVYAWYGGDWLIDEQLGLQQTSPAPVSFVSVTGTSATDVTFLDERGVLHHYDGQRFDGQRATALMNLVTVSALAPNDLLVVDNRFGTWRLTGAASTPLVAPFTGVMDPYLSTGSKVQLFSATEGVALDGLGAVYRFSGAAWTAVAGAPMAFALHGFAMSDLWTGATSLSHWDGVAWTSTLLPGRGPTEVVRAIWGVSSSDLWVVGSTGSIWRNVSGSFVRLTLPMVDAPAELHGARGTSADDVWLAGTHFNCNTGLPAVYHWDGATLTRYQPPTNVAEVRLLNGGVFAGGGRRDCSMSMNGYARVVWEHVAGAWVERPLLDFDTLFPGLAAQPGPPVGAVFSFAGTSPRWAAGEVHILRKN